MNDGKLAGDQQLAEKTKEEIKSTGIKKLNRKMLGDSGSVGNNFGHEYSTEFSLKLQGQEGSINFGKMSRSDAQVGSLLRSYKDPIKACNWDFEEIEDATPDEERAVEILKNWIFEDADTPFPAVLSQILTMLEYGFSLFERTWQNYNYDGGLFFVPVISQRLQESIYEINNKEKNVKQTRIQGDLVEIPFEDCVFFTLDQQGEDKRGMSLLRNGYKTWEDKVQYITILGIGAQRSATGIPSMKVPAGTKVDSQEYADIILFLENICQHENAYMVYEEHYEFSIHDMHFNSEQLLKVIQYLDSQLSLSVLVQFALLGQQGKGGSFGLGKDQSETFFNGLQCLVSFIESVYHKEVIKPFLQFNFGDKIDVRRIRLRGKDLDKKAGDRLAALLKTLKDSGFIKPEITDEQTLRKKLQLPELSEEQIKEREEMQKSMMDKFNNPEDGDSNLGKKSKKTDEDVEKDEEEAKKLSERVKAKTRNKYIEKETKHMREFMQANLLTVKEKLLADIERVLTTGKNPLSGLRNIQLSYVSRYQKSLELKLASIANTGWNDMKKFRNSKRKAKKLAEDMKPSNLPDDLLKFYIVNAAANIVEDQVTAMKSKAINSAQNSVIRGFTVLNAISVVDEVMDEFLDEQKVAVGANISVTSALNFGNNQFNKSIDEELWGYEFMNDSPETDICKFYKGKTFKTNDPSLAIATPPLHPRCDSYLIPIFKFEDKPDFDNAIAPPTIMKQRTIK